MESRRQRGFFLFAGALATPLMLMAQAGAQPSGVIVRNESTSVLVKTATDQLRLTVCSPTSIHVVASPDGTVQDAAPKQPWLVQPCTPARYTFTMPQQQKTPGEKDAYATLDTGTVRVTVSLADGHLEFQDAKGQRLLQEFQDSPRTYEPVTANGESLLRVSDRFYPQVQEALYGLGQHQSGAFNYRGTIVELAQNNTDVAIPMFVSTKGYGIFWNTAASSWFDNRFPTELKLTANAAHAIDYYFLYGPEFDGIVHQYRTMTGHAPLFSKWAYGFWQSKDRYKSDDELLKIAGEYRDAHVPLDGLVQDWYWWVHQGDPELVPERYPDVPGTLRKLHDENIHAMISVWAIFDPKSRNFQEMEQRGLVIPGTTDYDATNPGAGRFFWDNLIGKLFAQGWDAFWLDSSEPEVQGPHGGHGDASLANKKLFIGNGALYTNVFPLMHTENVYDHWRATGSNKRVFLLTRSGFAGEQRNAAVVWSGDVYSTFQAFQRQIPAGLNYALSGMPYWTTDIAGYGPPYARDTHDPKYQELYTRWFQFGVFCPIFRTHGHRANEENELFSYGAATPTLIRYDKLRYRMLPYIYSQAWDMTSHDGTMMRPLVMDWRTDENTWNIGDEFMFGPSLLVSPVTQEGATSRFLYLPAGSGWYDFWNGTKVDGGTRRLVDAPVDRIPLYVKSGSIVPLGPAVEYAEQKTGSPTELRIYPGADAEFTLYDDAGDGYGYEKEQHATISMHWNNVARTLTLGARQGSYPGMEPARKFRVILVGGGRGAGDQESAQANQEVTYEGQAITIHLP